MYAVKFFYFIVQFYNMDNEEQLFLSKFGNRIREIRLAKNPSQKC
jgi:hypothetical protein